MVELAARESAACADRPADRPVSLSEIAQAQLLSLAYLEQLFGRLRRAGLVASARGPGGGYRLGRPCAQVTIAEIVEAVDEPITATRCEEGGPGCLAGERCLTHDLWAELGEQIHLFLAGITLADVVAGRIAGRACGPLPAEAAPASPAPGETLKGTPVQ
jgi:Rrf2 family iron-sulfur cluster assembly transcriptional regulator